MPTRFTTDPGKSHMKITAVKISINHRHDIRPPEAVPECIHVVPGPLQFFKVIFNALVICTCLRIARLINIIIRIAAPKISKMIRIFSPC